MNYGFAPSVPELDAAADPEQYCLQLYRQLLGDAQLRGRRVVEVSCGRGGGAAHLAHVYQPGRVHRHRHQRTERRPGVTAFRPDAQPAFQVGNAEALPLAGRELRRARERRGIAPVRRSGALFRARRSACSKPGGHVLPRGSRLEGQGSGGDDRRRGVHTCSRSRTSRATSCRRSTLDSERRENIVAQFPPTSCSRTSATGRA